MRLLKSRQAAPMLLAISLQSGPIYRMCFRRPTPGRRFTPDKAGQFAIRSFGSATPSRGSLATYLTIR